MAVRLKLFAARQGFFDTVVAAPSRKAALDAWGVRQDLFKEGLAAETDEPAAKLALEHPGVVLRRMAGSAAPYAEAAEVDASALPPSPGKGRPPKARSAPPPPKPPDRSALDAAEQALAAAEADLKASLADLDTRRRALDEEETTLRRYHDRRRGELDAAVRKAAAAYRQAGGET